MAAEPYYNVPTLVKISADSEAGLTFAPDAREDWGSIDDATAAALSAYGSDRDTLRLYLREIGSIPRLSDSHELILMQAAQRGHPAAQQQLVEANLRLVVPVARRYVGLGFGLDDLIGEGNIGLIRAAQTIDADRGVKFGTHATWLIRKAVSEAVADRGRAIRLPVFMNSRLSKLGRLARELVAETGSAVSNEQLAAAMELPQSAIVEAHMSQMLAAPASLEAQERETPHLAITRDSLRRANLVAVMRDVLTDQEYEVLGWRFGLFDDVAREQADVGNMIGKTGSRVGQIEKAALEKLRQPSVAARLGY